MEKFIHSLISNWIKGVDTYTHNGSTWLIFTDSKKWVIELTESKTLWYNYNFFKQIFEFTSLDVVENQQYITKWVEDNIINKVNHTVTANNHIFDRVEDAIQNGVKETSHNATMFQSIYAEDSIQNGVKVTITSENRSRLTAENIIENGVRYTTWGVEMNELFVDDAIQNGVKHTEKSLQIDGSCVIEDTVQNGVKHTEIGWHQCNNIDDAIEYGVKETMFNQGHRQPAVKNIIENGVRETNHVDVMGFYNTKMEDVLENGVKKTQGTPGWTHEPKTSNVIDNGIKETKTPGEDGDIVGYLEWVDDKTIRKFPEIINDIIDNGIKETNSWNESIIGDLNQNGCIDNVIKEGVKETKGDASQNPMGKVTKVIKEGIKNPTY